jgi:hypothetical protein
MTTLSRVLLLACVLLSLSASAARRFPASRHVTEADSQCVSQTPCDEPPPPTCIVDQSQTYTASYSDGSYFRVYQAMSSECNCVAVTELTFVCPDTTRCMATQYQTTTIGYFQNNMNWCNGVQLFVSYQ